MKEECLIVQIYLHHVLCSFIIEVIYQEPFLAILESSYSKQLPWTIITSTQIH